MDDERIFSRSPLLINRDESALLVVDVQEKLLPHVQDGERMVWQIARMIRGANLMNVPVLATEQYPKGLGPTTPEIKSLLPEPIPEKLMFSCRECREVSDFLNEKNIQNLVLVGIETHVCVLQTAFDFMSMGWNVFLAVDGVSSRFASDREMAIRRMENSGVVLTTVESLLFEWCEKAGSDEFKQISKLVQESFSPSNQV